MENETTDAVSQDDWASALAEQQTEGLEQPASSAEQEVSAVFEPIAGGTPAVHRSNDIDLILDIPVQLTVELGRAKVPIKDILQMAQGSVVELDALAGEPLDVFVNGCLVAQGEVVVVNDKFGIRLTDIVTPSERIRKLNR
jgi:flagellar motor switch protein FliN